MQNLRCPRCRGEAAHRSHRRSGLERVASAFGFWPYRCDDCSSRFWRFARDPVMAQRPDRAAAELPMVQQPEPARPRRSRVPTPPSSAMA